MFCGVQPERRSETALQVALHRAAHQLLDTPRVLDDPLALRIVGVESARWLEAYARRRNGRLARAMRAFVVARSRYAEDELRMSLARGVRQYVVLGAGLDTSAYRLELGAQGVGAFEVDHPATQAWKRAQLTAAAIRIPPGLRYAAVDFETQTLADGLCAAGFDPGLPTFFSWLGVTPYLEPESIRRTLRFIAARPKESTVVFDYAPQPAASDWMGRFILWRLARRVARMGEPWRAFFPPEKLLAELRGLGFGAAVDVDGEGLNARYFRGRLDGLRVGRLGHIARAVV